MNSYKHNAMQRDYADRGCSMPIRGKQNNCFGERGKNQFLATFGKNGTAYGFKIKKLTGRPCNHEKKAV